MKRVFLILMTILVAVPLLNGAENISDRKTPSLQKALATSDIWIDVNRMDAIFRNNGTWMYDNVAGGEGLFWPKGTHNSPIFAGGQWLGAMVDGEVRIAGVQHSASEFQAGEVISPGVAANRMDGKYKWYTLYPGGVGDWTSWPVDQGAPVDENGAPLLIGDVTAFSVWNDLRDHDWVGTNKLSAEVRQTVFAFNRADALGDMIFIKWQIINKSGGDWDSTYFSIWLDPDLGDAGDDLVGCDSTLGLGYCYNAGNDDQTYGSPPPATGIDFFQGPIIDEIGSTVALPDGTVLQDKTMLKMTSFVYYDNNDQPWGNPDTGGDVWNYMRGIWRDGLKITEGERGRGTANPPTNFMFSGDPETLEGWLDYDEEDRRFLMTTGPFDMGPWVDENLNGAPDFGEPGVQEIVAVVIVASGADNLNSVTVLKEVDELAQMAYDLNFNLANAPAPPAVTVSELPNKVVLTWDEASEFDATGIAEYTSTDPIVAQAHGDTVVMDNVEKVIDDSTYNFYGYTVYQYADAAGGDPVVLEHWDNGGEAAAVPYVSQRFVRILVNKHTRVGEVGADLINGKPYYFGLVAEGYLEYGAPKVLPSAATIVTAVPQYVPGIAYTSEYNDTLEGITHSLVNANLPPSDGSVTVWVADPSKTTGQDYTVTFNEDGTWNLVRSVNDTLAVNQLNQAGDDAYNVYDGLMVKVIGPAKGIHGIWQVANANGPIAGVDEDVNENILWINFLTAPDYPTEQAQGGWAFVTHGGGIANDLESFYARVFRNDNFDRVIPNIFDMRFTEDALANGLGYLRFTGDELIIPVPFELWNMGPDMLNTSDDFRMCPAILSVTADETKWNFGGDDPSSSGTNDPSSDWVYWGNPDDTSPGEAGYNAFFTPGVGNAPTLGWTEVIARSRIMNWNRYLGGAGEALDSIPAELARPEVGTILRWITNKPNSPNDYYTFAAPDAVAVADSLLAVDIKKINVVPNPYYGYHSGELNIFARWVQFTYLPPKATIRIYDLAGQLIRKLEKDDASTTFLQWDLSNAYELPVASGVYVYVVDTDYGQKIGKMAVFAPNERVDVW